MGEPGASYDSWNLRTTAQKVRTEDTDLKLTVNSRSCGKAVEVEGLLQQISLNHHAATASAVQNLY